MSNRSEHIVASAFCGAFFEAIMSENVGADLWKAVCYGLVGGAVGGILPDIVDPPTDPFHRGIGHGIMPLAIMPIVAFSGKHSLLRGLGIGYTMHLAMDAQTPMGLPI